MPPRWILHSKAPVEPTPAPIQNVFTMNASAFAPYAESISTLSSSHCCITAFSPSSAAPVPPVITMDTNSGATQFILRTLYNEEGNEFTVHTLVRDQTAVLTVLNLEEVPQLPMLLTASTHQRMIAIPTNSREPSHSQSHISRGRSQTCRSSRASNRGDKDPFTEGPSGNLSPDDGDGEGPADPVLPVVLLLEELLTQNLWNPLHNKPSHFSKALKDL